MPKIRKFSENEIDVLLLIKTSYFCHFYVILAVRFKTKVYTDKL